jgi:hypothetical protein
LFHENICPALSAALVTAHVVKYSIHVPALFGEEVKVLGPEGATRVSLVIRTGGHKIIAMA